jgi:hypothetical protein
MRTLRDPEARYETAIRVNDAIDAIDAISKRGTGSIR